MQNLIGFFIVENQNVPWHGKGITYVRIVGSAPLTPGEAFQFFVYIPGVIWPIQTLNRYLAI